jgi:hypothetical protein
LPDEAGISLSTRIARLKAVKQQALAKKKEIAKELKAAQKKLKKVKGALSLLSDGNNLTSLQCRNTSTSHKLPSSSQKGLEQGRSQLRLQKSYQVRANP